MPTDDLKVSSNNYSGAGVSTPYIHATAGVAGNLTAATAVPIFVAPFACRIVDFGFGAITFPTTTDRTATVTLKKITGTTAAASVATTDPAFAATAGGSGTKHSFTSATGITPAVLKTDGTATLAKGDVLTYDLALAGINGTLGTGLTVDVVIAPLVTQPTSV